MRFQRVLLASLLALIPTSLLAQESSTSGFNLGLALNGSSIEVDDPDFGGETETGGGLALRLGYNFSGSLGLFLNVAGAVMEADQADEYELGQADIGGRYTFLDGASAFRPYAEVAFTGISAQADFGTVDVELNGSGFTGGLGFNYFFNPQWAIDILGQYTAGSIDELVVDGSSFSDGSEIDITTGRFDLGVAWYP